LVAEYAQLLAGLQPRYKRILRRDDGVAPVLRFYLSGPDQEAQLMDALAGLEVAGFAENEIVVLAGRRDGAATRITVPKWRDRLGPLGSSRIGCGTVHAFKGLEAPAIIVTDVESITSAEARALFYVAATRPLQRLIILAHERVRDEAALVLTAPRG